MSDRPYPGIPSSRRKPEGHWKPKVRKITGMAVHAVRNFHPDDDPAAIRARVIGYAREAIAPDPDNPLHRVVDLDNGQGPEPTEVISLPGALRIVADDAEFDLSDPADAETFMAEVQRSLDDLGL